MSTIGPKIAVVDSIPDGAVYGDDGRAFLRMYQALIQPNVINMTTATPPSVPVNGDQYVVASVGTGAWSGKTNYIAYWSTDNPSQPTGEWEFYQPLNGWVVRNRADNFLYTYNGSSWVQQPVGVTSLNSGTSASSSTFWRGDGTWATAGGTATSIQGIDVSSSTPRTGDTFRYNQYGDSKWDIASSFVRQIAAVASGASAAAGDIVVVGSVLSATVTNTSLTALGATATEPPSLTASSGAGGSPSISAGVNQGATGGAGKYSLGAMYRFSCRVRMNQTTNARYWIGLAKDTATGVFSGTATDTPNTSYVAFRYSAGTDTTIKAVCGTSNILQTVSNTGISVDTTNSQLFEIVYVSGTVYFYINGTLVTSVASNVPTAAETMQMGWGADNQNTANVVSGTHAWMALTFK